MRQTKITVQTKEMLTYVQMYVERLYCTCVCDEYVRGTYGGLVCTRGDKKFTNFLVENFEENIRSGIVVGRIGWPRST